MGFPAEHHRGPVIADGIAELRRTMRLTALLPLLALGLTASAQQERLTNVKVGDQAPEIVMADPEGRVLRLSELKGKVVLVDFWASWCRPCRMDNPNVRRIYHSYKDRTFTVGDGYAVFSVSLDRVGGLDAWKAAIAKDSLDWKWHVGAVTDGENGASEEYGVRFIPTNVLIDGTGKVIAVDLHGEALEAALQQLLERDPARLEAASKRRAAEARDQEKAGRKQDR